MRTAITQARAPRGTDDAGNCWLVDYPSGELPHAAGAHEPVPQLRGEAITTMTTASESASGTIDTNTDASNEPTNISQDKVSAAATKSMFTLLSSPGLSRQVEDHLVSADVDQFVVDCSLQEDLDSVLDDATWPGKVKKIQSLVQSQLSCACLIHPGTTFTTQARPQGQPYGGKGNDHATAKAVRIETCLALRLLHLVVMFSTFSLPWMILTLGEVLAPAG